VATFGKVLVPTDGSAPSLEVLGCLRRLVGLCAPGAEVTLLRVLGPGDRPDAGASSREVDLRQAREAIGPGVRARAEVVHGDPATEIVRFAKETGQQLIAMTTHGRRGPARWLLGSVAEQVLRDSDAPVLLCRRGVEEGPAEEAS
jgi:nucleotide-binding universal stress UspA family protein